MNGKAEVSRYLGNYARTNDWRFALGFVDGRPAVLACNPDDPSICPSCFVLLQWQDDRLIGIRDFRYARYASEGAEFALIGEAASSRLHAADIRRNGGSKYDV
jgi:RNA polymerase sigma-70 factor (ECF subfamily)